MCKRKNGCFCFYCSQSTLAESRNVKYGKEIDIFLPDYMIGIEYNGIYWHKNKKDADKEKIAFFANKGVRIISVNEETRNNVHDDTIEYVYSSSNKDSLNWAIEQLLDLIGINTNHVNAVEDASEIYAQYVRIEKGSSISSKNPLIASQWNYERNGILTPEMIMPNSNKKVWWICSAGHEWQAVVSSRVSGKNGCPYCAGQKVLPGYNDLCTTNPDLASEWHSEKNGELLPTMVSAGSRTQIWWACPECKQPYLAAIYHRNKGRGCPHCSNKIITPGINDLASLHPDIAEEWNYQKNGDLLPTMISSGSGKTVWWKCSKNHEWQASVANRVKGRNCPYCGNKKVLPGYNDLATLNPNLAAEWHPTRNEALMPTMVIPGSHKKVWWQCKMGHEWQATVGNRNSGNCCPQCARFGYRKTI